MPESTLKIAIAGAGLLGKLFAWRLSKLGHQINVYEKNAAQHDRSAAWTAAAMISPMSEVVVSERSIYDLGLQSMDLWERWLSELPDIKQHYARHGSIVIAHPQDENELYQFQQELHFHLGKDNNSRWLERRELTSLEPDICDIFQHGLYLPDEAHLNNRALLAWLSTRMEADCNVHWQSELTMKPLPQINGVNLENVDLILDCRGMGAHSEQSKLRGVRGEVIHVQTSEVKLSRPLRLMHPRYKLYVVPKPDERFIIGATELESADSSPMSVQSTLELCSALYTINPAFAEARILELDANLRPAYRDNLPAIVETEIARANGGTQKIISVNGLYRHGYLIAPALVEQVISRL